MSSTIIVELINKLAPRGKYEIKLSVYHAQTQTLLKEITLDFKFYGRSGSGDMPLYYEHQWAFIGRNEATGQYDRLIISHDAATIFVPAGDGISRKITVKGLKDLSGVLTIDDEKEVSFTPKSANS